MALAVLGHGSSYVLSGGFFISKGASVVKCTMAVIKGNFFFLKTCKFFSFHLLLPGASLYFEVKEMSGCLLL